MIWPLAFRIIASPNVGGTFLVHLTAVMAYKSAIFSVIGVLLLAAGCNPESGSNTENEALSGETVTILGTLTGTGETKLMAAIAPFTEETGIEVIYEGTDAFTTVVPVRVDSGNTPDIALFPQPGLMADFAREGKLVPLDRSQLTEAYSDYWLDLASVDGDLYGMWMRASVKSLVWYNPEAFAAAGYVIPATWDELQILMDQIVADGATPWCIGMESGKATGWVGTDWVEEILLRQAGPEIYDQWVAHDIAFTHPAVKQAVETFGAIALNPDYVLGGPTGIISTPFGDSPQPLFSNPPNCYLHRQANFISEFLPEVVEPEVTVDVFALPPMEPDAGSPVLVGGILFGQFNDTPAARALMKHLAQAETHRIWASEGYISPHEGVAVDAYPDPLTQNQARVLKEADLIRFDGSDQMPGAVGTGSFWSGMVDYVGGKDLDTVLADIEASWPE